VFVHPAGWGVAFARFDKLQEAQAEFQRVLESMELHEVEDAGEAGEEEPA
jgi:hypothetical protein